MDLRELSYLAVFVKYYQLFIKQGFTDPTVFSNYGVILKNLGKLQEAEISTRKAIELKPNYADFYSNLGSILKEKGELESAVVSLLKAIELQPDSPLAHFNLGKTYSQLERKEEAEKSFKKAIYLKKDFRPIVQLLLGICGEA